MEQSSHRLDQSGSASGPFPPQASSLPGSMGDGPRLPLPQPGPSLQSLYDQDHAQDDDGHDEGGPKKRKRIERACFGCRQRRSKCDGGMPCSVCTNNNSECTYPPPPRRVNIKYVEDLERRLADLEATQAQATQQQQSQPPQGAPAAALFEGPPSPRSQTAQPNTSFPTVSEYSPHQYFSASDSRKLSKESPLPGPEPRSSGSGSIPAVEEDRRRSSVRSHSDPRSVSSARAPSIRSVGGSNAPMLQPSTNRASEREFSPGEDSDATTGIDEETSRLSSLLEDRASKWERLGHDGVATEVLENAAARLSGQQNRESRLSAPGKPMDNFITQALAPSPSYDEMYALPSRVISDNLTSYYRSRIHYLFPILHWPSFMEKYEEAWSWTPDHKQKLKSSDHIFLATLNLIWCCATALRSEVGDTQLAATFFKRSQALVSVPHILLMGNLGIINYLLLLCKYSHSCSKGNLSSNAVGLAILMARGLHLHSQQVNETFGPLERILRQRAWAGCLEMEATSSAMLYRQTTSADVDFDPSGFPPPYDDDEITSTRIVPRDKDEPHKITFFLQSVKLFAIKCRILRQLYDMNSPKIFPHAHDVLVIEEDLLLWWKEVPEYLKKPETDDPDFILQSHVLASRYVNAQILLYRPFLFYFCTTPGGSYPVPDSLKFNLAIKSATVCADAAIELISRIVGEWTGMMLGWWWYSLGYVYSASLVILARRIVDNTPALGPSSDKQEQSAEVFRAALDFFIELGWHATEGLGPKRDRVPPESVQSTARRCYRILVNIERAIKNPKLRKEEARSSGVRSTTLVPPSRYSRKPDPSIPPLRLDRASNPFDDDHFISSWINLMQPASRDEAFVPKDFLAPTPFDLSHRANNPSAPPNHTQDHSYQNWASLLGSGFLSNFDPVQNVTPEDAMAGQLAGGSQRTAANTAQWWGGAEARQTTTSSTEARRSGSSDSRNQQAQQQQQQQQQQPQQQRPSQSTALNDVGGVGERASHLLPQRGPFGQGGPYTEQDVTNPDQGPIMGAVWGQPPQS